MKKRVCPICEREMHSSHYCSYCRTWIREPYIRDINYYLNESHPAGETSCTYHEEMGERKGVPGFSTPKSPQRKEMPHSISQMIPQSVNSRPSGAGPAAEDKNRRPQTLKWVLWLLAFIYIILPLLGSVFSMLRMALRFLL